MQRGPRVLFLWYSVGRLLGRISVRGGPDRDEQRAVGLIINNDGIGWEKTNNNVTLVKRLNAREIQKKKKITNAQTNSNDKTRRIFFAFFLSFFL